MRTTHNSSLLLTSTFLLLPLLVACPVENPPATDSTGETGDGDPGDGDPGDGDPGDGDPGDGDPGDGDPGDGDPGDGDPGDGDPGDGDPGDGDPGGCTSLYFDGEDDMLFVAPLEATSFTIEAWVRPQRYGYIAAQKSLNTGFNFYYSQYYVHFDVGNGASNMTAHTSLYSADQWQHVVGIYDGTNLRAALNGKFGTPQTFDYAVADKQMSIGGRDNIPNYFFQGEIHSMRISEGARYTADFDPPEMFENDAQTLRLWQFGEGMGELTLDEATNSNDMILGTAHWANTCPWSDAPTPVGCGNGVLDPGEECDDGNDIDDDGCLSNCTIPTTCADYLAVNPFAQNGEYPLFYEGNPDQPWTAYCDGMNLGEPAEYLPLVNVGGDFNFAQYTAASNGTDVRTNYERLRIDPLTLEVHIDNRTFASSMGGLVHGNTMVTAMSYAVAMGCNGSANGVANIDLVGTPFMVDGSFCQGGWMPVGGHTVSADGQIVNMTGGGSCGWTSPEPCGGAPETGITNIKLQLAYMD
jgi:cysteine-rich repeat protein